MLFSRVYNWIKYKTLPPSVLFLNRLFVERDSKHRRATSNLGLTFRNSKWSTYARVNINLNTKKNYISWVSRILLAIITLMFVVSFANHYVYALPSAFHTIVWFILDADIYCKALFTSSLVCILQSLFSSVQNALVFNLFNASQTQTVTAPSATKLLIPSRLHKPLLYSWAVSGSSDISKEQLFELTKSQSTHLGLYRSLYSVTKSLTLELSSLVKLRSTFAQLTNPSSYSITDLLSDTAISPKTHSSLVEYSVFGATHSPSSDRSSLLRNWSLGAINAELSLSDKDVAALSGSFYMPELSYSDLNKMSVNFSELTTLDDSLTTQTSIIRWHRWLYKYNILHRSSIKAGLHINSTLKLLSSGFYDSSLTTRNIWASSLSSTKDLTSTPLSSLYESLYGDYNNMWLGSQSSLSRTAPFYNSPNITFLTSYSQSYYWYIQRFYQLNTLGEIHSTGLPKLSKLTGTIPTDYTTNLHSAELLNSIQSSTTLMRSPSSFRLGSLSTPTNLSSTEMSNHDVYLNYTDNVLLSKGRLETLTNVAKNSSHASSVIYRPMPLPKSSTPSFSDM